MAKTVGDKKFTTVRRQHEDVRKQSLIIELSAAKWVLKDAADCLAERYETTPEKAMKLILQSIRILQSAQKGGE